MTMRNVFALGLTCAAALLLVACPPASYISVTDSFPDDGATGVSVNVAITITLNKAANPNTFDAGIEPETDFAASWSANARTVTLTPAGPLLPDTVYTVSIWDIRSAAGEQLDEEHIFSFTTAGGAAINYRQEMRNFVQEIASYARQSSANFLVVPQNGEALLTANGAADGAPSAAYIAAIDGQGREDLFYGYDADNEPTPSVVRDEMLGILDLAEDEGVEVLVTDYCSTRARVDDSYTQNEAAGFISFAAHRRDLDAIPTYPAQPHNVNASNVTTLAQAQNFLYVLDPGAFASRAAYLAALAATDYDLLIIDLFFDDTALTSTELDTLRIKEGGGARLLIAYMSIGEAEDYRYYWQPAWAPGSPSWLQAENPDWAGNYKVRYWDPGWHAIIFGSPNAYLDRIVAAGFDGVYLDIIDAYDYFEAL